MLIFMMGLSIFLLLTYQKVRKDGVISYLPSPLKRLLLNWYTFVISFCRSFFDVLSELFIIKGTYRLFSNIIAPFLECETKEKARSYLSRLRRQNAISPILYHSIFKKGLLHIVPRRYRSFLVPEDERELKKMMKI